MPNPVILLAFANERNEKARYLRNLPRELNLVREMLVKVEEGQICEVVLLPNATLDQIVATFQREKYRDRIAIFHYGGHAGSYSLLLEAANEGNQSVNAAGFVPFLAAQRGLQLVFLNGCYSAQQAQDLVDSGIAAVIGTANAIDDHIATNLAASFYQALGEGIPLDQAWQEAVFKIKAQLGTQNLSVYYHQEAVTQTRDMVFPFEEARDQFPWQIYYREGAEVIRNWSLPTAANDPYFGLPSIADHYSLPDQPYRFLERYRKTDARIFFGRGQAIRDLYFRLNSPHSAPLILLYGQSGVGKSSLLEAGLFPRLEADYDIRMIRRNPAVGLLGHLKALLDLPEAINASLFLQKWKTLEANSNKKGVLLVFDQVEEVFTRPRPTDLAELSDFLALLSLALLHPEERPQGKIMLSYRKDYDPEIEKACRSVQLPKEKVFLDRLDRNGIIEIVEGLARTPSLYNKYGLTVEKNIGTIIADDLLVDNDSPLSPVLQITLTRLWQSEEKKDKNRQFTVASYNDLRVKGVFLNDFFHQQMEEIKKWASQIEETVESAGLALDILHFHTTKLGTAQSRSLDELRSQYTHRAEVLEQLITQFKSFYLLTALNKEESALAHDTLAPIVQKELSESTKPGQRAFRILAAKGIDYDLYPEQTYLDEEDLMIVEEGAVGMRLWTAKEETIVAKSRQRRLELEAGRRKVKTLKRVGVAVIAALAVLASFFGVYAYLQAQKNALQAEVSQLVSQALQEVKTDATKAMATIQKAMDKPIKDANAIQARHDIYTENEFYHVAIPAEAPIRAVALSADGKTVLAAVGPSVFIRTADGELKQEIQHPAEITAICISPNDQYFLTMAMDGKARLWQMDGIQLQTFPARSSAITAGAFSPDSKQILVGTENGDVVGWDVDGAEWFSQEALHEEAVSCLVYSPDGNRFFSGGLDGMVYLLETSGKVSKAFEHPARVLDMAIDKEGKKLAVACRDGIVRIRFITAEAPSVEIRGHKKRINSIAFTPDDQFLLTASDDQQIKLWDLQGNEIRTYRGHVNYVNTIAVSSDGTWFVSGGEEGQLNYWQLDSKIAEAYQLDHAVTSVSFSPDGQRLLIATGGGYQDIFSETNDLSIEADQLDALLLEAEQAKPAFLYDLEGQLISSLEAHAGPILTVSFSPDGRKILTGSEDASAIIWDSEGKVLHRLQGHDLSVVAASFSPDGTLVATASNDSTVILWDTLGQQLMRLDTFAHIVSSLAFSPDGQYLLSGCRDGKAWLWDMDTYQPRIFVGSGQEISAVAYAPNGKWIAAGESGVKEDSLSIWNVAGALLLRMAINSEDKTGYGSINSITFGPDSQSFAVATGEGTVKVFDLKGNILQTIRPFMATNASSVAISPNGHWILVGYENGGAKRYHNITNNPIETTQAQ